MAAGQLMSRGARRPVQLWLAVMPPALATAGILWFSLAEISGRTPFSSGPPANIAEAAGLGSGAELLRLLRERQNPHVVLSLSPDVISSTVTKASAVEAAVWSRRLQVIELLDREGALADPAERHNLLCLARDLDVDEIVTYLAKTDSAPCEDGRALAAVQARSRR
jgi:hypothetical protein